MLLCSSSYITRTWIKSSWPQHNSLKSIARSKCTLWFGERLCIALHKIITKDRKVDSLKSYISLYTLGIHTFLLRIHSFLLGTHKVLLGMNTFLLGIHTILLGIHTYIFTFVRVSIKKSITFMCTLKERDMHTFGCLCWLYQVWVCKS